MKWSELSAEQRDALIHEKVMQRSEPEICDYDPKMTFMTTGDDPTSFDWHCHKCGAHGKVTRDGYYRHPRPIPRYTTSMDAAWQVVQALAAPFNPKSRYDYEPFTRFTDGLFSATGEELYTKYDYMAGDIAQWTPYLICLVALRAVGVEIEE